MASTRRPTMQAPTVDFLPVDDLHFDTSNPRLVEVLRGEESDEEILRILWREMAVDEIALSVANNGFFLHEPIFATKEGGEYVVIEGNRRLAAVKLLRNGKLRRQLAATDLPEISDKLVKQLATLPVIVVKSRNDLWQYIGFRHVNGPQTWQSFAKASYIAWVHNKLGVELEDISKQIGDKNVTVHRLYRGLMALRQAERAGVFSRSDRWKKHFSFSHLYTGLDYPGIQAFIGLDPKDSYQQNPVPKVKLKSLGLFCEWLYGSKKKRKPPLIESQNPDLRILDEILQSKEGIVALNRGLPLKVSYEISKGDNLVFREAIQAGKQALQKARGTLLSGYQGERDLFDTATEILDLASTIRNEMDQVQASAGKVKPRRVAR